jgi:hypothetical protein
VFAHIASLVSPTTASDNVCPIWNEFRTDKDQSRDRVGSHATTDRSPQPPSEERQTA